KPDVKRTEIKLQEKLQQIREIQLKKHQKADKQDNGLCKKIIGKIKKII
ncbi:hypothetical protein IFN73_09995, partial [Francisella tularensis subsp. holarctica]|nr:hypothetical protein [Francisella tularensis subsp. holarctica]